MLRFALSAFIRRGLCLFPVAVGGCGRCLSFWRSGASARPGVSFVFLFWRLAPVLLLSLLAAAVGFCPLMLVAAVGVPLLVPCGFCPPWGVFLLAVVSCLLFVALGFYPPGLSPFVFFVVTGVSSGGAGASARPERSSSSLGWLCWWSFGALGFLPTLRCLV